jgi:hypothetical protein
MRIRPRRLAVAPLAAASWATGCGRLASAAWSALVALGVGHQRAIARSPRAAAIWIYTSGEGSRHKRDAGSAGAGTEA